MVGGTSSWDFTGPVQLHVSFCSHGLVGNYGEARSLEAIRCQQRHFYVRPDLSDNSVSLFLNVAALSLGH